MADNQVYQDGDDHIVPDPAKDGIVTGGGHDVVVISDWVGTVTVKDFDIHKDRLDVSGLGIASLDEFLAAVTISDTLSGLYLSAGHGALLLEGVMLADVTAANLVFADENADAGDEDGYEYRADDTGGYLRGSNGDDTVHGGAGDDTFYGRGGDDVFIGGDGYNQFDLDGRAAEYRIHRNGDGSYTITGPSGTDRVKDVGGFWFGDEGKWYSLDEFVEMSGTPELDDNRPIIDTGDETGRYYGTRGDDRFIGTEGRDIYYGGAGDDVFHWSGGNDVYRGGSGVDEVVLAGRKEDYRFAVNDKGELVVGGADGTIQRLSDIERVVFEGEERSYDAADLVHGTLHPVRVAPNRIDGTMEDDNLFGTDGRDIFRGAAGDDAFHGGKDDDVFYGGSGIDRVDYDGTSSDYSFSLDDKGRLVVSSETYGVDRLVSIEGLYFRDEHRWYDTESIRQVATHEPANLYDAVKDMIWFKLQDKTATGETVADSAPASGDSAPSHDPNTLSGAFDQDVGAADQPVNGAIVDVVDIVGPMAADMQAYLDQILAEMPSFGFEHTNPFDDMLVA